MALSGAKARPGCLFGGRIGAHRRAGGVALRLPKPDQVLFTVVNPRAEFTSPALARIIPVDLGDAVTISNPGTSYSSNTAPRGRRNSTVGRSSVTFGAIWVWSPDGAPA